MGPVGWRRVELVLSDQMLQKPLCSGLGSNRCIETDDNIGFYKLCLAKLQRLEFKLCNWLIWSYGNDDQKTKPVQTLSITSAQKVCDKPGSQQKRPNHEDDEDDDNRPAKRRNLNKTSKKSHEKGRMLACPLHKKDPLRHWKCVGFASRKISYVKQHIYRSHMQPPFCASCGTTFERPQARDEHITTGCILQPFIPLDGITKQQRDSLHQRVAPHLSLEDQWYAVFDIVCPGHPRPISPYHDWEVSETVLAELRLFFSSDAVANSILEFLQRSRDLGLEIDGPLREALSRELGGLVDLWAARRSAGIEDPVDDDMLKRPSNIESPNPFTSIELQPFSDARGPSDIASTSAMFSTGPSLFVQDTNAIPRSAQDSMPLYAGQGSTIAPGTATVEQLTSAAESRLPIDDQGSATLSSDDIEWLGEFEDTEWADPDLHGFGWA